MMLEQKHWFLFFQTAVMMPLGLDTSRQFPETWKVSTAKFPESFRKNLEIKKEIRKK